jgi:hypothetical protein
MTIDIDATYRDGALHPETPLNLPENTPVRVRVVPKQHSSPTSPNESCALPPKSPLITPEDFDAIIRKYSVSVGSLPVDFSREDIYSDHD